MILKTSKLDPGRLCGSMGHFLYWVESGEFSETDAKCLIKAESNGWRSTTNQFMSIYINMHLIYMYGWYGIYGLSQF